MKKNLLYIILLFTCSPLFAQGGAEGLRLTRNELFGTARGQAMGGAFGALGGDATAISINPGGLGVYRSSEISATLNVSSSDMATEMNAVWMGVKHSQNKLNVNFNNLSVVGYFPTEKSKGLSTVNFSFVYNRLKNFNRRYSSSALSMGGSVTDYIAAITNGINSNEFDAENNPYDRLPWLSTLGWNGNFINDLPNDRYESYFFGERPIGYLDVREQGQVETFDFSLGTNFSDHFYVGATFAMTNINYSMTSSYEEAFTDLGGSIALDNYLHTEGTGYQLKIGGIWRPTDYLRIGAAYHSPTWYSLTDTYWADAYNNIESDALTPEGHTSYEFYAPSTWVFSLAGILGTEAILSLDYEIKDYRGMDYRDRYGELDLYAEDQNSVIDSDYRVASTLRLGAEYRFTPQFSGRLGYSFLQNPYETEYREGNKEEVIYGTIPHYTIEGDVNYFTAGIGYRFTPQLYVDAAFVYRMQEDDLYYFSPIWDEDPSVAVSSLPAHVNNNSYKVLLTLGCKFY